MSEEDSNSRSSTKIQRLKRTSIPNTIATRRPSSPVFNGKQQQATKRSVTIDNNNNDLTSNIDDISSTKRFKRDDSNVSETVNFIFLWDFIEVIVIHLFIYSASDNEIDLIYIY